MPAKANKKQTLAVLLLSVLLITLCTGGLWFYVKNADAETDITETSPAQIPDAYKMAFTAEKYDNYPLLTSSDDDYWYQGKALKKSEVLRLAELKKAYAKGVRPIAKAPSLPGGGPIAIIPLNPEAFAGMTEYYLLSADELTNGELLMLIDYGEEKGVPITPDTLTTKNCMRGCNTRSNRNLSAGESERMDILLRRVSMEGLQTVHKELTSSNLPISGAGVIRMDIAIFGADMFLMYPIREMTDEELLTVLYYVYQKDMDGFTYLNPAKEEGFDPSEDAAKIRAFLEDVMDMPIATENIRLTYKRKDATGEIHTMAYFKTGLVNGRETGYTVYMDKAGGDILYASSQATNLLNEYRFMDDTASLEKELKNSRWVDIARETMPMITKVPVASVKPVAITGRGDKGEPCITVEVGLENDDTYMVQILILNETVVYIRHWDKQSDIDSVW